MPGVVVRIIRSQRIVVECDICIFATLFTLVFVFTGTFSNSLLLSVFNVGFFGHLQKNKTLSNLEFPIEEGLMGVDFYNCDRCGEIYASCSNYGSCEGCDASWCEFCAQSFESFWVGDAIRCDLCFHPYGPPNPSTEQLLELALFQLKKTRDELHAEWEAGQEWDRLQCDICGVKDCALLAEGWQDDELTDYSTTIRLGRCCKGSHYSTGEWCTACEARIKQEWITAPMTPVWDRYGVPKDIQNYFLRFVPIKSIPVPKGDPHYVSLSKKKRKVIFLYLLHPLNSFDIWMAHHVIPPRYAIIGANDITRNSGATQRISNDGNGPPVFEWGIWADPQGNNHVARVHLCTVSFHVGLWIPFFRSLCGTGGAPGGHIVNPSITQILQ